MAKRIFVVDDEKSVADSLARILADQDMRQACSMMPRVRYAKLSFAVLT